MLFRRRDPASRAEKVRIFLWPRRSWDRSTRYMLHRLWRLRTSSHAIAIGFAAGVFASFTPLLGLHFILAGVLAWALRGSVIASAIGTFVGNPITFPLIWIGTYKFGNWILGNSPQASTIDLSDGILWTSVDQIWPVILPMLTGAVPLGATLATILYFAVRRGVEAYRIRRAIRSKVGPGTDHGAVQA